MDEVSSERRRLLRACALAAGASGLGLVERLHAAADNQPLKRYDSARLVDGDGRPLQTKRLAVNRNYLFNYPYAATPCFLLVLDRPVQRTELRDANGARYAWPGGVGPKASIVAYSAICAHKLAYPAREVSFIRFQEQASPTAQAGVIHCCAEHSIYDPAAGARVVSGPAPQPLAAIALEYDAKGDELIAIGTVGAEQFEPFFAKYEFKLGMEHGPSGAKRRVGATTACREMSQVCRQTIQC
jgi:Rieske Fe-S protein